MFVIDLIIIDSSDLVIDLSGDHLNRSNQLYSPTNWKLEVTPIDFFSYEF